MIPDPTAPEWTDDDLGDGRLRVLIVEDNLGDANLVCELLGELPEHPFAFANVDTLADARERLANTPVDIVLLDLGLPDSVGMATLAAIQRVAEDVPVVVFTGQDDERLALEALKHGAQDYLVKGRVDGVMLRRVLQYAIERKQAAVALRESEQRFRDYAASSSDWFWETDAEFRYTYVSVRFQWLTGVDVSWLIGKAWRDTLAPGQPPDAASEAFLGRRPFRAVEVELAVSDLRMAVAVSGVPVFDQHHRFVGYRGTASDITEQRRMREALNEAKEKAEEGARAKSSFLAIMGHEVKTPLNGILGMAQLLLSDQLDERQRARVRTIAESGEQLLSVLDDILDFTRLEAGRLPLQLRPFSLSAMIGATRDLMQPLAAEKGLSLDIDLDPELAEWWSGDPIRLRQVLVNLLANAIKFTERGGVTVAAQPIPGSEGFRLSVEDSGVGIAPEHLDRLFSDFSQIETAASRSHGGSGLGLAICKRLVTLMNGRIGVHSTPGTGSTFWVELPLTPASDRRRPGPRSQLATTAKSLRVLLVEDHEVNRSVAAQILEKSGHEVVAVDNGPAGLAAFRRQRFDVVLLDLMMPGMDGEETARRMRRAVPRQASVPILAFTAHPEATGRWRQMGFDGFVGKPLRIDTFEAALSKMRPPQIATADNLALVDTEELAEDVELLGWQEVHRLLSLFEKTGNDDFAALRDLLAAAKLRDAVAPAHRLGSASASMHMPALAAAFRRLERNAVDRRPAEVRTALAEADELWQPSLAAVRDLLE